MSLSLQTSPGLRIQFSAWGAQPHCSESFVIPQGMVCLWNWHQHETQTSQISPSSAVKCLSNLWPQNWILHHAFLQSLLFIKQNLAFVEKNQTLRHRRTSLVVQWLRLNDFTSGGTGLIPGQGTKILYAVQHGQKGKKKKFKKRGKKWFRNPFSLSKVSFGNFKSISKT